MLLGRLLGAADGLELGNSLGRPLGAFDGDADGTPVGIDDGLSVLAISRASDEGADVVPLLIEDDVSTNGAEDGILDRESPSNAACSNDPSMSRPPPANKEFTAASVTGDPDGPSEGASEGPSEGASEGASEGIPDGISDGTSEGVSDRISDGMSDGASDGVSEGVSEGVSLLMSDCPKNDPVKPSRCSMTTTGDPNGRVDGTPLG